MTVLDSSAVLAYIQGEDGADIVEKAMPSSTIGAANLSEVLSKFSGTAEVSLVEAILSARGVSVEPVTRDDARLAAQLRSSSPTLSLGDRLCLALAARRGEPVLTADRAWGVNSTVVQIR
jgi:ribonuclease VapC